MKYDLNEILPRDQKKLVEARYKQVLSHWHLLAFTLDPRHQKSVSNEMGPEVSELTSLHQFFS